MKLFKVSYKAGAHWHIPKIPNGIANVGESAEIYTLCGLHAIFVECFIPDEFVREDKDVTAGEACQRCLRLHIVES